MAVAFLGSIGLKDIMAYEGSSIPYTNSFFALLIFVLSLCVCKSAVPQYISASKRDKVYAAVFALLLSIALQFGARLESADNVNFVRASLYLDILCLTCLLAPLSYALMDRLPDICKVFFKEEESSFKLWKVWTVIFVLWIPSFLAFFPGAFVYDATDEYVEVISRSFTTHHPLIHVLLLGGLTHLGEYLGLGANGGIAAYTLLQMVVLALVFSYMIILLGRWGLSKKYCLIWMIILGVFPIYPMYALCSAKDTYFSAAFLMVMLMSIEFVRDKDRFFDKRRFILLISATLMMLLRNNGVYALICAIPFIALAARKGREAFKPVMKFIIILLTAFVLYEGISLALKMACNAEDNEHQEMLTVPIQQLARVYYYEPEVFSEEELATLHEILPENYLITYNARCSDVLKSGFDNEAYSADPAKYRKLWWEIGLKKPLIYLNAWLVNSYGYWYPDSVLNGYGGNQMYTFSYDDSSYFGFETEPPGERESLFPMLEEYYRNISLELFQQKVPVLSMLFAPGFCFYVFAFTLFDEMRKKRWMAAGVLVPVLLLWGTALLGPVVLVRYVLIFWFMAPLLPLAYRKVIE